MSDAELTRQIEAIRNAGDQQLKALQDQASELVASVIRKVDEVIAAAGRTKCAACKGYGVKERLDAGYMQRFGLREWNGCATCGGDGHEIKGRGFTL